MNRPGHVVYAYGLPSQPRIVATLEHARRRAADEAETRRAPQFVMRIDLARGDLPPEILGQANADGTYEDIAGRRG